MVDKEKTVTEVVLAAQGGTVIQIMEKANDCFESGRRAGIEEALKIASATYKSLREQKAAETAPSTRSIFGQRSAGAGEVESKIRALLEAK